MKSINAWDIARRKLLRRIWATTGKEMKLDRGVNFFILALESLGVKTIASCQGHPTGFYILFDASYETALMIASAGFFQVAVSGRNRWLLTLGLNEKVGFEGPFTERLKRQVLRLAASGWIRKFELESSILEGRS